MCLKEKKTKGRQAVLAGIVAVMLSFFCAMPVWAAPGDGRNEGILAEIREDFPEMVKRAQGGSPEDQLMLGFVYAIGADGRPDYKKALYWYEKAASQGEETACYMAYVMHVEGMGTKRDLKKAEKWAKRLVEDGKEEGYLLLGMLYDEGSGSRRDYARAAEYYRRAMAGSFDAGGNYRLGMFYLEGKGVRVDREKALFYLERAADDRDIHAAFQLGMMYYEGREVPKDEKKAWDYFNDAVYVRPPGMFDFGADLLGDVFVPGQPYSKGMGYLMGKDPNVQAEAWYMMGRMAEEGRVPGITPYRALTCYGNAAERGHALAKRRYQVLKARLGEE